MQWRKKGRAIGGFIIGKREEWGEGGSLLIKKEEGLILTEIKEEGERIGMSSVYNNVGKWKNIEASIDTLGVERERDRLIIGGDFNIRIGVYGDMGVENDRYVRFSKDEIVGNENRNLIRWIGERGWYLPSKHKNNCYIT